MSTVIIAGGGSGHRAMQHIAHTYSSMTADQKAAAVEIVRAFVEDVNQRFGTDFSTTEL